MLGEVDTAYRKTKKKSSPQKATHKHAYLVIFTMNHIRRFDGSISKETYKFSLPPECVDCGHVVRRTKRMAREIVEVEVSPSEFAKIKKRYIASLPK